MFPITGDVVVHEAVFLKAIWLDIQTPNLANLGRNCCIRPLDEQCPYSFPNLAKKA